MSTIIIYTILTLGIIGVLSAIVLYFVAQKFKVFEDPRIDQVEASLPGANCGGCGYAGCRAFADVCVTKGKLTDLFCPVGGNDTMANVAAILGIEAIRQDPKVAVVRCNGTCEFRPKTNYYDGSMSCAIAASLYSGDTGCQFGCLSCGDCVIACDFDAIHMNPVTGLPEVNDDKCVACGACAKACPKILIEMRKKAPKNRKIYVACRNKDKGAVAGKVCTVACIGCSKCEKECQYGAITIAENLAFIDSDKCKLCRKCVIVCPTNSILEMNFPPRKITVSEESTGQRKAVIKNKGESVTDIEITTSEN